MMLDNKLRKDHNLKKMFSQSFQKNNFFADKKKTAKHTYIIVILQLRFRQNNAESLQLLL